MIDCFHFIFIRILDRIVKIQHHIPQMQKQLREATAATFLFGWKSHATVFLAQSIFWSGGILPGSTCLLTVVFLQLSSYWVWAEGSTSNRWKVLLQFPVRIVEPSGEEHRLNLSKIAQFSNISEIFPFTPYWITTVCKGFFALQISHTLIVI